MSARAAVLCLLLAGCRQPAPPAPAGAVVLDLAATLEAAGVEAESAVLEMGRQATRRHLVAGWSQDEADAGGPFVWGVGTQSVVELFAVAPADLELGFTCRPFVFAGAPEQRMSVAMNGRPLGEIVLGRDYQRYRVEVPAAAVESGVNRMVLGFAYHRRPSDVVAGSEDDRELAVACREIAVGGLGAAAPPRAADEQMELPAGIEAAYYFALDGPAELAIDRLAGRGVELVASFRTADSVAETRRFEPGGPVRWRLDAEGPAIGRLTLSAARATGWPGWLRRFGRGDGVLTLRRPVVLGAAAVGALPPPRGPANVVVYLVDTLRADHLGAYGYPLPTSPAIDRFAAEGIVFLDAQAQSSWTRPAVASLFTGLGPGRHGVEGRQGALPGEVETLAEILQRAGYDTAGFVTNGNVAPEFAFDQGFAAYRYLRESGTPERHRLSDHLNEWVFDWLAKRSGAPFLLYVHATDPHAPYVPRENFRARFAAGVDPRIGRLESVREIFSGRRAVDAATRRGLTGLYDAEIAFNDHHFGRLLERLRQLDLYDSSLVVLVSDHGEELFDHGGWEHGKTLYGEQLHVPLIVKLPAGEQAGRRVAAPARQVDVLPTILARLGVAAPPGIDGRPLLAGGSPPPSFARLALADRQVRSVTALGWKLILDGSPIPHGPPVQLYHLAADRGETAERSAERPFEGEFLAQLLRRRELELARGGFATPGEAEISEELRQQLQALGYL